MGKVHSKIDVVPVESADINSLSCPIHPIVSVNTSSGNCMVYSENTSTGLDETLQSGCSYMVMPSPGQAGEATKYNHVSVPLTNVDSKKYLYFVS